VSRALRIAIAGTLIAAGLQVLVGVLLWVHRADFALAQARLHPELSSVAVRDRAEGIVYGGLGTHLVLFVVYLVLARGVLRGRPGARVRLTALLLAASVAGGYAAVVLGGSVPTIRAGMMAVQAASTALRLTVLYLLWMPLTSRAHFTAIVAGGRSRAPDAIVPR